MKKKFLDEITARNREDAIEGWLDGWWDLDDDFNPIAKAKVFRISEMGVKENMSHVMHRAGAFSSVSDARRNGWNKPLEKGEWTVTKRKIRVRVTD